MGKPRRHTDKRAKRAGSAGRVRAVSASDSKKKPRSPSVGFLLRFGLIAAGLFGLYCFPYAENGFSEGWFHHYLNGYAELVGFLLSKLDPTVAVHGNVLSGRFSMSIIKTCDAMEINILTVSAIAAFPGPWKRKLVAVPVALAVLVSVNIARLISLYFVGVYRPNAFEFLHFELFPLVMVAVSVLLLLGAVRIMRPAQERKYAVG